MIYPISLPTYIKKLSLIMLISSSSLSALYEQHAHEWMSNYVQTPSKKVRISPADLQILANLLYFSFLRSSITVEAQEIASGALEVAWEGWQNIAQTRMNPSVDLPYKTNLHAQKILFEDFLRAQSLHRQIGTTYANAAEIAVKAHILSIHAQESVTAVREQARTIVAHAFLDVQKVLGELFNFANQYARYEYLDTDEAIRFDLFETIASYIPYLTMQTFIETEHLNTRASEQTWNVISTIIYVSKRIWHSIESARAAYYLAHYQALLALMQENEIDMSYQKIMFDERGMIPTDEQVEFLPDLSMLELDARLY